ncbi:MAG: flagellar M-ring protein FliF C-terminal domain-containing protein [Planctomycetota bacterium]|jgi:flagellar biosynthesis/type III secretory pathway M-ring protein FliF/YscJ
MTSGNLVTETYDPTKVTTKEEITTNEEKKGDTPGAGGKPAIQGGTKTDETILTEYVVGKTVEQKIDLPGDIISLSVAAVVDLSPADANEAAGAETAKIMELAEVEELIKNALGLKVTDSLKVAEARFPRPAELPIGEEESGGLDFVVIARQASLGITAICALLVLLVFRGAKKKASAAVAAAQLPSAEQSAGLLPEAAEGSEPLVLRKQIAGALQSNPAQVKQLFASWIEEKG